MQGRDPHEYSHIWIYSEGKKIPGFYLKGKYFDRDTKKYKPDKWQYRSPETDPVY